MKSNVIEFPGVNLAANDEEKPKKEYGKAIGRFFLRLICALAFYVLLWIRPFLKLIGFLCSTIMFIGLFVVAFYHEWNLLPLPLFSGLLWVILIYQFDNLVDFLEDHK